MPPRKRAASLATRAQPWARRAGIKSGRHPPALRAPATEDRRGICRDQHQRGSRVRRDPRGRRGRAPQDLGRVRRRGEGALHRRPASIRSAKADWSRGEGKHEEQRLFPLNGQLKIDRETEHTRSSQRCAFTSTWFPRSGVRLAIQGNSKANVNDYDVRRDNPVSPLDRCRAFNTGQDLDTCDLNGQPAECPRPGLHLVTQYDHQQSRTRSQNAGLEPANSARRRVYVLSQGAPRSPVGHRFVTGDPDLNDDALRTPTLPFAQW